MLPGYLAILGQAAWINLISWRRPAVYGGFEDFAKNIIRRFTVVTYSEKDGKPPSEISVSPEPAINDGPTIKRFNDVQISATFSASPLLSEANRFLHRRRVHRLR